MKLRLIFAATTALFTLTAIASAQEQPWLNDRRYGEGIGLRSGNLEFHPGIAAEVGYDSNYFQRDDGEGIGVTDAWRLRVTPSLSMSTLGVRRRGEGPPPSLAFQARLFAAYNEFFGADDVSDQRRLDYGAGFRADVGPQRRFGADLSVDYLRTGEPSNDANVDVAFDRGTVKGGAGVSWRPGGGLFDWRLGYQASYNYFEDAGFETLDNVEHGPITRGRWRFLPRTALLYDARYMMVRYLNESSQPDGDYVEARVGLSGLFTTRFAFLALLGWNSSYYEAAGADSPAQNYDGFVAHGELKWFLLAPVKEDSAQTGLSSIAAGYIRSFSNSYLGSFYIRDRGYATFEYFLGGVFMTSITGGISHVSFPTVGDQASFSQNRFDVKVYGEYRTSDVFAVNASVMYDQVLMPDGRVQVVEGGTEEDLEFSRFQAYLGARLFW